LAYTASEEENPDYFNVYLQYSDDNGENWSPRIRVHEDETDGVQQFYSSLFVNDQGVLIMDWYDRSNYDNSNQLTDFIMGISYDGGETFYQMQLNSAPMDFGIASIAGYYFGIGEYHQCVASRHTTPALRQSPSLCCLSWQAPSSA